MKAIFFSDYPIDINNAYIEETRKLIKKYYDINNVIICKSNIDEYIEITKNTDVIFSTWGMEHLSKNEIKKYFPKLKYIFYAGGSVHSFAKEFLDSSVRIFSARVANAIPVAEYVFSTIILSNKGTFVYMRNIKKIPIRYDSTRKVNGNYKVCIGIIGVGLIGKKVIDLLNNIDCNILYYDPYLSKKTAKELNITEASLETIFENCDCITNHLPDKKELENILDYSLFSKMKPYATFINTARAKQVNQNDLIKALKEYSSRTAILDVFYPIPLKHNSPLLKLKNVFITPHIAGSLGLEISRMGLYMAQEAERIALNQKPLYEITKEMLKDIT